MSKCIDICYNFIQLPSTDEEEGIDIGDFGELFNLYLKTVGINLEASFVEFPKGSLKTYITKSVYVYWNMQ